MQDPERKTPIDGDGPPRSDPRASIPAARDSGPVDIETPRAGTSSRSIGDLEGESTRTALARWRDLPLGARVGLAVAGGMTAVFAAVLAPPWQRVGSAAQTVTAATRAGMAAGVDVEPLDQERGGAMPDVDAGFDVAPESDASRVWRVGELEGNDAFSVVHEVVGQRALSATLVAAHVPPGEVERVTDSLSKVRALRAVGAREELTLALEKATSRVVAFELASSPLSVWQGREESAADSGPGTLTTRKLTLALERVRLGLVVVVGADLRTSIAEAGISPLDDVLAILDDALEGHTELSEIRPGARLRLLGTQDQVGGRVVRWVSVDAVEYFPANGSGPSVRVYAAYDEPGRGAGLGRDASDPDPKRHRGWYDAKGRQPFHGGYRTPVPLARIASRYNPRRMHPVLHVIMPHNGVDFAAPPGAPVYATAAGTVTSIGADGPCGNKVEISHPGGITSVYCHLSRYASGLRVGAHVEQRQLIAYVGQTGRVTGPHLHFGIKRNGVFVDPMTLRLDSVRVVPRGLREEFDRRRVELDKELDGIPLPVLGATPAPLPEPELFLEEP